MSKKLKKELIDQPLHIAMTAAPLALAVFLPWTCGPAAAWFMFWREDAQHRKEEGWRWMQPWETRVQTSAISSMNVGGWRRWMDIGFGTLGGVIIDIIRRTL